MYVHVGRLVYLITLYILYISSLQHLKVDGRSIKPVGDVDWGALVVTVWDGGAALVHEHQCHPSLVLSVRRLHPMPGLVQAHEGRHIVACHVINVGPVPDQERWHYGPSEPAVRVLATNPDGGPPVGSQAGRGIRIRFQQLQQLEKFGVRELRPVQELNNGRVWHLAVCVCVYWMRTRERQRTRR